MVLFFYDCRDIVEVEYAGDLVLDMINGKFINRKNSRRLGLEEELYFLFI